MEQVLSVQLSDGRRLAYSEYGLPADPTVLMFHGFPGSRLDRYPLELPAGVRYLVPDRPGYGYSDPQAHRTLSGWATDVEELVDSLEIERFGLLGVSGGGPHALVCAARLPHRTQAVVSVCGVGPMDRPGAAEGMHPGNQMTFELARTDPEQLLQLAEGLAQMILGDVDSYFDQATAELPEVDRRTLARPEVSKMLADTFRESCRQGGAALAADAMVLCTPWDFDLGDVSADVFIWQGTEDANVPSHHAEFMADALPSAQLEILPGEGHLSLAVDHGPRILETLLERMG